ncbi:16S rRNA (guanine(527)-N(7))-methyltransferase RsmG [Lusitaniella coriacea LEGE 07157]|uniref:Ribosomal RNA small subunit methyltransferase G n=1 Tax=Lusitaniella coriacea LEGE 07157 TaxID=945747 RepID=A0A8J7DYZ4_9CYAN|nr:16S rRNA (guanine(527)-N(7))-methyltransferase RsmG [Lusitaniella coriacea]MBE9118146.1 16S rRNA (guanine(527)-N(7))-methyltransferase RsmG [Lusitaniella coriacea LEGE 07157]
MTQSSLPALPNLDNLWQTTLGWQPTPEQTHLMERLYEEILEGNRQLNLTRITEPKEFWEKHLWDSLAGVFARFPQDCALNVIDIGTGAGFPGLPHAIAHPTSSITLLDSTRKKIHFLDRLIADLGIANAIALLGRAEQIGRAPPHHQKYDLALLRAIGTASLCAQYALPFLKLGGTAILYRGRWSEQEQAELESGLHQWGGAIAAIEPLKLPLTQSTRHCIYIEKN